MVVLCGICQFCFAYFSGFRLCHCYFYVLICISGYQQGFSGLSKLITPLPTVWLNTSRSGAGLVHSQGVQSVGINIKVLILNQEILPFHAHFSNFPISSHFLLLAFLLLTSKILYICSVFRRVLYFRWLLKYGFLQGESVGTKSTLEL